MDCEDSLHAIKNINIPRKMPALKRVFMLIYLCVVSTM
jgi:hypothetical protein